MSLIFGTALVVMCLLFFMEVTKKRLAGIGASIPCEYGYKKFWIVAFAATLIFISGFRYGFVDTSTYRYLYIHASDWDYVTNPDTNVEVGFRFFMHLLNLATSDSQSLLIVTALTIQICFIVSICRYSDDKPFSLILYFLLVFMDTNNGVRQLLVASVWTLAFELVRQKKAMQHLFLILLLSTIHRSILIMIPLYFVITGKRFNWGLKAFLVFCLIGAVFKSGMLSFFSVLLGESVYVNYLGKADHEMNFLRLLVGAVPCLLAIIYFALNKRRPPEQPFDTFVNILFINFGILILATQNLYFARLAMYMPGFVVIIIPMLLKKIIRKKNEYTLVKSAAITLYALYFYFQIQAFGNYMSSFRLIF